MARDMAWYNAVMRHEIAWIKKYCPEPERSLWLDKVDKAGTLEESLDDEGTLKGGEGGGE